MFSSSFILTWALAIAATAPVYAGLNENYINCSGTPGVLVKSCAVTQNAILIDAQPFESNFYVSYQMTCNRNYRGPKPSFSKVSLENGQSLTLQYNDDQTGLLVGTGLGPLTLGDVKPIDLVNLQFNDCQLIFTALTTRPSDRMVTQWEGEKAAKRAVRAEYLRLTKEQVKLNTSQLAGQQGNLYFRTGQKIASACLIGRYESEPLYSDVIADLKNNYIASFGEDFSVTPEQCAARTLPKPSLHGLTCDVFTAEGLQKQLARNLTQADRFFYETCQIENNYNELLTWFQHKQTELAALIGEVELEGLADIKASLQTLLQNIDQVTNGSCTEKSCQVVDVAMGS